MSTVAEQLCAARESRHLTLEQVANLTRLRVDQIRAVEEGRFDYFSATVYVRGSVKSLAKVMNLDQAALLAQLDAELGQSEKFSEPPPLVEQKKTLVDFFSALVAKLNWKMGFTGIAAIAGVVLLVLIVWLWHHQKTTDHLRDLPPAIYQPANPGNTLPLHK
jgi:cytoskeleton protein RodZ